MEAQILADFIEKFRLFYFLIECRVRHMLSFQDWRSDMADNRHRAKLPENPVIISLSGQICKLING
jgi:hypothetical protein